MTANEQAREIMKEIEEDNGMAERERLSRKRESAGWAVYENEEGGFEIIDRQGRSVLTDVYAYDSTDLERETRMDWIAEALNAYSKQPNDGSEPPLQKTNG